MPRRRANSIQIPWQFGAVLRHLRTEAGMTLKQLGDATRAVHSHGISEAHLSRLEGGHSIPDLADLYLISSALGADPAKFFAHPNEWWGIIRGFAAQRLLEQQREHTRRVRRPEGHHREMIEKGIYRYAPLEHVEITKITGEASEVKGTVRPRLQALLFEASRCDKKDIEYGKHPGEEIVYVLMGELELLFRYADGKEEMRHLQVGDCAHYLAEIPHAYRHAGTGEYSQALFVYVRDTPVDGDSISTPPLVFTEETQALDARRARRSKKAHNQSLPNTPKRR